MTSALFVLTVSRSYALTSGANKGIRVLASEMLKADPMQPFVKDDASQEPVCQREAIQCAAQHSLNIDLDVHILRRAGC